MCLCGGCYTKNYGIDGVVLNAFLAMLACVDWPWGSLDFWLDFQLGSELD